MLKVLRAWGRLGGKAPAANILAARLTFEDEPTIMKVLLPLVVSGLDGPEVVLLLACSRIFSRCVVPSSVSDTSVTVDKAQDG